jgi:bifunctional DNA-binding transcriptional regulator/antitoxin component of YhaV-PrlF toxin-antitoxin module
MPHAITVPDAVRDDHGLHLEDVFEHYSVRCTWKRTLFN